MGENNLIAGRIARRDGDHVTVETPLGEVHSRAMGLEDGDAAGGAVSLVVRPENIFVIEGDVPGDVNGFEAEVVREVFIGSEDKLIVRPKNHPQGEIMVKIHSDSGRDARAGQKIRIGWRAENGWLIAGADPARA
jgi:ABC-type Fe3+/spermidine/putrescine transport system ATPase subunit